MFTFHAFSSRLSPGFVSLCPFPTKLNSFDKWQAFLRLKWKYPGILSTYPLYCIPDLTRATFVTAGTEDDWKIELFGVLFGILFSAFEKIPGCHRHHRNISQGRKLVALSLLPDPPPSSGAPGGLRPPRPTALFPCGFAAPSSRKHSKT